jgi:hypothetical protein
MSTTKTTSKITFSRMTYEGTYHGKPTDGISEVYCNGEHVGTIQSYMCEEDFVRVYGIEIWDNEYLKPGESGWDDYWRCGEHRYGDYFVPREPRAALNHLKKEIEALFI